MPYADLIGGDESSGIPTPDPGVLATDEMLKADTDGAAIVGTGDTNSDTEVDFGTKTVISKASQVDSGTINMVGLDIKERGGYLQLLSAVSGLSFISVDYQVDETGSIKPLNDQRGATVVRDIVQPVDSTVMNGITGYSISPITSKDIHRVYINLVNPVTNFRVRVTSDTTGKIVKYIPSRSDFNAEVGISLGAGEGFFDLGTALPEIAGFDLTIELIADQSIDVLGDGVSPWRAVDSQAITSLKMIDESDIAVESVGTSWISGGDVTESTTLTIDIAAGKGRIVNAIGDITHVSWDEKLNQPIPNIATKLGTRILIDVNGDYVPSPSIATAETNRDYVMLALVSHAQGVVGRILNNHFSTAELYPQFVDGQQALGVYKKSGLAVSPNANLTFARTAGILSAIGIGTDQGERGQNLASFVAENPAPFLTFLGTTGDVVSQSTTLIDPGFYDDGAGTKTAITGPAAQSTIMYVYQSVLRPAGLLVMYGQFVYSTLDDAILNASSDRLLPLPEIVKETSNLIARIAVRSDCSDLSNLDQAEVLAGVKFGTGLEGVGFGSSSGGGDYLGPASSIVDEVHTFADTSGKVGESNSDVTITQGLIKRATGVNLQLKSLNGVTGLTLNNGISTAVTANTKTMTFSDDTLIVPAKVIANSTTAPVAVVQANTRSGDIGGFTEDLDVPFVGHIPANNGGATPAAPISGIVLTRQGVSNEAFTNIVRFDLSRYADTATDANTQLGIRLAKGSLTTEGNNNPLVAAFRANGQASIGGDHSDNDHALEVVSTTGAFKPPTLTTVQRDALTVEDGAIISNSTTDLLEEYRDGAWATLGGGGDVTGAATSKAFEMATFGDASGKLLQSGSDVNMSAGVIRRSTTNWNLTLDNNGNGNVILGGNALVVDSSDNVAVGGVTSGNDHALEVVGTDGAFKPPTLTTTQRDALTVQEGAMINNSTTDQMEEFRDGAWAAFGSPAVAMKSIVGRTNEFARVNLAGINQTVTTGSFHYYRVDGAAGTPDFVNGIWTIPADAGLGVYLFTASGLVFATAAADNDFCRFVVSRNNNDPTNPSEIIHSFLFNNSEVSLSGQIEAAAGDTIRIKYSVLGGTGWSIDGLVWDVARIADY